MLVVDLLHEFELGVWKAVFTQLLRMLECLEESKLHELDRRSVFCPYAMYPFDSLQISPNPDIRTGYYSPLFSECVRDEAYRGPRLRGSLTGWSFDLLLLRDSFHSHSSAPFPSSKTYFRSHTIHLYLAYSLFFAVGMDFQKSGCTQMKHCRSWRTPLSLLGENSGHLVSTPAPLSRLANLGAKRRADGAGRSSPQHPPRQFKLYRVRQKRSTYKRTSCMPSGIMCLQLGDLGPPTPIRHNLYEILLRLTFSYCFFTGRTRASCREREVPSYQSQGLPSSTHSNRKAAVTHTPYSREGGCYTPNFTGTYSKRPNGTLSNWKITKSAYQHPNSFSK